MVQRTGYFESSTWKNDVYYEKFGRIGKNWVGFHVSIVKQLK